MSVEKIYPKVAEILADVLDVDPSSIQPNSFLISDLGAESIDFLDITFQLEREFKVKIPRSGVEKAVRGSMSEEEFEVKGVLTPKGLEALKAYLPEVPAEAFKEGLKVAEIPTLFTVKTMCNFVEKAQAEQSTA